MFEMEVGALGYLVHCEQVVQNTLQFVFLHAMILHLQNTQALPGLHFSRWTCYIQMYVCYGHTSVPSL